MNQKIKELAEQHAGSILMDLVMPDAGIPERIKWNIGCTTDHLEKFAKLIVAECISITNEVYKEVPLESCGYFLHLDEKILEHFYGVEE